MSKHYLTGTHVTDTYVAFFGEESIFSNFYRCPNGVIYGDFQYTTSEHAFMAAKASYFGDQNILEQIRSASTNGTSALVAKRLGREISNFDIDEWNRVKISIMYAILFSKFSRDPNLSYDLLCMYAEGSRKFVEASPYDTEWGCGLSLTSSDLGRRSSHRGRNLMGRLLDEIAEQLCGITITKEPRTRRIRRLPYSGTTAISNKELQEFIESAKSS